MVGAGRFVLEVEEAMFGCGVRSALVGEELQLREDNEDGWEECGGWGGEGGCETWKECSLSTSGSWWQVTSEILIKFYWD